MKEIQVEYDMPIVFTKDTVWMNSYAKRMKAIPGALLLLPDDAILVFPKTVITQATPPNEAEEETTA